MRVLFLGEGKHDIGREELGALAHAARGVVPILTRKVCPEIEADSLAAKWANMRVLPKEKKKWRSFWAARLAVAQAAARKYACTAIVVVLDRDGYQDRFPSMKAGKIEVTESLPGAVETVCGQAIESIEAWTLGAPTALAATLGLDPKEVSACYKPHQVEEFHEQSGKDEHCGSKLLQRIAELRHYADGIELRERVAEATDLLELCKHCKNGFEPFHDRLREKLG